MDILATIITACGGAAVTGIFALIASNRARRKERVDADVEIVRKLDALSKKLDKHIEEDTNRWADNARSRALAFGDEVRRKDRRFQAIQSRGVLRGESLLQRSVQG